MFFILNESKVREKMEKSANIWEFLKIASFYFPLLEHTAMQHFLCKSKLSVS